MLPTSVIKAIDTQIFEVRQNDECLKIVIDKVLVLWVHDLQVGVDGGRTTTSIGTTSIIISRGSVQFMEPERRRIRFGNKGTPPKSHF
jgi:hypothetical protein